MFPEARATGCGLRPRSVRSLRVRAFGSCAGIGCAGARWARMGISRPTQCVVTWHCLREWRSGFRRAVFHRFRVVQLCGLRRPYRRERRGFSAQGSTAANVGDQRVDHHLSGVRGQACRSNAGRCMHRLLRLRELRSAAASESRRLLRLLLLRVGEVPAHTARRISAARMRPELRAMLDSVQRYRH